MMPLLRPRAAVLLLALPLFQTALAQTIALDKEDATVWAQEQVVSGQMTGAASGTLYVNGEGVPFTAEGGAFAVPVRLAEEVTTITACASATVCTEPLRLTLGYAPRPEAELVATASGAGATLRGRVLENPTGAALSFSWALDPENPAALDLAVSDDSTAALSIPEGAPAGEYYIDWTVRAGEGAERRARTFVTVEEDGSVSAFDPARDHAAWIERAVIYEISPLYFHRQASNRLRAITEKLPEIASFGVNTIWLQPVTQAASEGQGYDVVDYFSVWGALGSEEDLHELVETAHGLGLRVLLDLVPNHTSIQHPYAQDAIAHGPRSHYFDFYQRERSPAGTPYRASENTRTVGQMPFVYYFWTDLVNMDYHNPEVRRHLIEAGRYWIEEFDIDGYRLDAVWGVNGRNPEVMQEWRLALKRLKPEILLLGEDKATRPEPFEERFDAAYDWYPEESWVSHWTWQPHYSETQNPTIFNHLGASENARAGLLRDALTNRGNGWAEGARVLRFMENNDTHRFIATHDLARTKMAAALLFSLPGLPLVFNGQEVGNVVHPYGTFSIFGSGTIESRDQHGLVPYYRHLAWMRGAFASLSGEAFAEVSVGPEAVAGRVFAYRRWEGEEHVVAAINMGAGAASAALALPVAEMGLEAEATYVLTDLVTGEAEAHTGAALASLALEMPGYTTRVLAVADSAVAVPTASEPEAPAAPAALALEPNYPNPFSGQTTLAFRLGRSEPVRLAVFDVLGREVALLAEGIRPAGRHTVSFDGSALASGLYLARLETPTGAETRRMLIVR